MRGLLRHIVVSLAAAATVHSTVAAQYPTPQFSIARENYFVGPVGVQTLRGSDFIGCTLIGGLLEQGIGRLTGDPAIRFVAESVLVPSSCPLPNAGGGSMQNDFWISAPNQALTGWASGTRVEAIYDQLVTDNGFVQLCGSLSAGCTAAPFSEAAFRGGTYFSFTGYHVDVFVSYTDPAIGPTGSLNGGGGVFSELRITPEPASLVLLGTGLLGVGFVARRRRARPA